MDGLSLARKMHWAKFQIHLVLRDYYVNSLNKNFPAFMGNYLPGCTHAQNYLDVLVSG
jgi:hypothetical protein